MPKIKYKDIKFKPDTLTTIKTCNSIIATYAAQGFDLTLRQLYYQMVSRGLIANAQREYSKLGSIVNDARLAGLIDWESIVDRTRELRVLSHWERPQDMVATCARQFRKDKWEIQPFMPEVWVEKDALIGVVERICEELDVPCFSCRGYTSQSEMWNAAQRILGYTRRRWFRTGLAGQLVRFQKPIIFHLGDHDPSGKDMTRDVEDRLAMFCGRSIPVERLALNMDQVEEYEPPPNPAKLTDSRCQGYIAEYGESSWELDALEPTVIADLIREAVLKVRDEDLWKDVEEAEQEGRDDLAAISENFSAAISLLERARDEKRDPEED